MPDLSETDGDIKFPRGWDGGSDDFTVKRTLDGHITPSRTYTRETDDPDESDDLSNPYTPR